MFLVPELFLVVLFASVILFFVFMFAFCSFTPSDPPLMVRGRVDVFASILAKDVGIVRFCRVMGVA